jgi:DNA-binding protein HU-beta
MTKADFVSRVAGMTEKPKKTIEEILQQGFWELAAALEIGDEAGWPGFGTFKVVERAARAGRNPQTGAKIQIPASKAVKFGAAKHLRDAING